MDDHEIKILDLNRYRGRLKSFITKSIQRFTDVESRPKAIGMYSHPGYGWVSTKYHADSKPELPNLNCPDFEFTEFDIIEFQAWEECYWSEDRKLIDINNRMIVITGEDGDEKFKTPFYNLLVEVMKEISKYGDATYFVQMLDSDLSGEVR